MFHSEKRFIDKHSFFDRSKESMTIMSKYTDRFPIICEKNWKDVSLPNIDKHKYLVPNTITIGQFMYVIRKRIKLQSEQALFLFVGDDKTILPVNTSIDDAYYRYKNKDGFLYVMYSKENVFG